MGLQEPELEDLEGVDGWDVLDDSASKLKISADLEPNLTTLLLSSKKPLKTVL